MSVSDAGANRGGRGRGMGRVLTVAVLVAAFVASGVVGHAARDFQQDHGGRRGTAAGGPSLSELDSYALALLLGGLRGPLVMVLWINSENQKNERDLEGLDTQIEWIRLLQPEFDSVHLFQVWNKAYNISVQMVGLANKYATILDALDYAHGVLDERPNNLNVLSEVARIYSHKLGSSNEKEYYKARLRNETLPPIRVTVPAARADELGQALAAVGESEGRARVREGPRPGTASAVVTSIVARRLKPLVPEGGDVTYQNVAHEILAKGQPGWRRLRMDVMLDANGRILPAYEHELRFLKPFEPFPQGLSAFALAYNYAKWAQLRMAETGEEPKHMSDSVIDSRPGLELKSWAEDALERGRRFEMRAFGAGEWPEERFDTELPTADLPLGASPANAWAVPAALHAYARTAQVSAAAIAEYKRHLRNPKYIDKTTLYASHLQHLETLGAVAQGDHDYLRAAMTPPGPERQKLLAAAREAYARTVTSSQQIIIDHYLHEALLEQLLPGAAERVKNPLLSPQARSAMLAEIYARFDAHTPGYQDEYRHDRLEYRRYGERAVVRLQRIDQALGSPGASAAGTE